VRLLALTKEKTMATQTELKHILLDQIHEPDASLREVDRTLEEYVGLVESIRLKGILNAISVREIKDPDTGELIYGLVDGLQRFNAAKDVGLETIPCQVTLLKDAEVLEAQIMANVHKIETKPVAYSKALLELLSSNPLLTRSELASRLAKTTTWISERLGLLKLTEKVGALVDEDKIGLSNAYALAKLPPEEQLNFIDRAMTMTPQQFAPTVNGRVKELRDAKRKGKDAAPEEFQPISILRTRKELVAEMENPQAGPMLCAEVRPKSVTDAFALAVKWALNMDPQSVAVQRAKDEERKATRRREKEKSKLERMKKRADEAAKKVTELKEQAEAAEKGEVSKKASAADIAAASK